jgi:hypothetical protein
MAWSGRPARRSVAEWLLRVLLALALSILGYVCVVRTMAYATRTKDPEHAYLLSPGDGRVVAALAQRQASTNSSKIDWRRAASLSRSALQRDPTTVTAAATLGLATQAGGNVAGARRLFTYAERLSRRDLQTQLWRLEEAVGRGDVPGALRYYDIALRTSRSAPDLLFPILASALADESVMEPLTTTLARAPIWGPGFIDFAAENGSNPSATARFLLALSRRGVPVSLRAIAAVVNALVARGSTDAAWTYYAAMTPGVARRASRDPLFEHDPAFPSQFDWMTTDDAGVNATIQPSKGGGLFEFSAPASVGGPALKQLQVLPPGIYSLQGRTEGIDQPEESRPYWTLTCRDGRELGRVPMPNTAQGPAGFTGRFSVPTGCPVQLLTLVIRPSNSLNGSSGRIERVLLKPLG